MKYITHISAILAVIFTMTMTACQKNQLIDPSNATASAQAQSQEQELESVQDMLRSAEELAASLEDASDRNKLAKPECYQPMFIPECATVTIEGDANNFGLAVAEKMIIDYGDGCEVNGVLTKGKLIIETLGDPADANFYRTVTFEDFEQDGKVTNGEKKLMNITQEGDAHPVFNESSSIKLTGKVNNQDFTFTKEMDVDIEWVKGLNDEGCKNNIFIYSGKKSTIKEKGNSPAESIVTEILEPMTIDQACGYNTQGVLQIEHSKNKKTYTYDFGDGTCDNLAMLTIKSGNSERTNEVVLD